MQDCLSNGIISRHGRYRFNITYLSVTVTSSAVRDSTLPRRGQIELDSANTPSRRPSNTRRTTGRKGTSVLGLSGYVEPEEFKRIPGIYVLGTGIRLRRMIDEEYMHRTRIDITFSKPMSVTLEERCPDLRLCATAPGVPTTPTYARLPDLLNSNSSGFASGIRDRGSRRRQSHPT